MARREDEHTLPRGRQSEARRNDARIVEAALAVFAADDAAPMSAVARAAGVGQGTLYRRYANKEVLLAEVCRRGLADIAEAVRAALATPEPWPALVGFLDWYAESGTLRMSALLGSFDPPDDLFERAHQANLDMQRLVDRTTATGALRADVTGADLTLLATQLGALTVPDPDRARQLRRRYLALAAQALALTDAAPLPGPAPDADELEAPWRHHGRGPLLTPRRSPGRRPS